MSTDKQMSEDRELVEGAWALTALCDESYRFYPSGTVLIQDVRNHWLDFTTWAAARAFTERRLTEIREIEEEIANITEDCTSHAECAAEEAAYQKEHASIQAAYERTIKRLETILADKKRGMR